MPEFTFTARDTSGAETSGTVDADSRDEAIAIIEENGYRPSAINGQAVNGVVSRADRGTSHRRGKSRGATRKTSAKRKPTRAKASKSSKAKDKGSGLDMNISFGAKKVKPKELMVFTRQLATLVNAGLPLVRSLQVLNKQAKNPTLQKAIGEMGESIKSGSTFAESLTQHPKIFDKLYVNMVRAGELGGVLDKVLLSLSEFMEKLQKIKGKVVSAMVYPAVVLTMATLILIFLMIFIIPQFEKIFADVLGDDVELPWLTRMVIGVSEAMMNQWMLILGGIIGIIFLYKTYSKTKSGRYQIDKFKLKVPLFGSLIQKSGISRMTRTLGTLMDSGVPVLQALTIVRETSGNAILADAVNTVHDSVKEGENMAPPMESTKLFPPMVVSMVEVGEETGELPQMLARIADNYEEEVDNTVSSMTSIIEPVMIVGLAFIVGTIVIALFLPLISLINNLQNQ